MTTDRRKQALSPAKRARIVSKLEDVYEVRMELRKYTAEKMAVKHGVTISSFKRIRQGYTVPSNLSAETVQSIRIDLMRFDELRERCLPYDEIANQESVSRYCVAQIAQQEGLGDDQRKPVAKHKRTAIKKTWVGMPMGKFATMRLTSKPNPTAVYY